MVSRIKFEINLNGNHHISYNAIVIPEFEDRDYNPDKTLPEVIYSKRGVFTKEGERWAFTLYNWRKYRLYKNADRGKNPVLDLIGRIKESEEQIFSANRGLVLSLLKKKDLIQYYDTDELVSAGYFALLASMKKFDYTRGYKFSSYAYHAIINSFRNFLRRRRITCVSEIFKNNAFDFFNSAPYQTEDDYSKYRLNSEMLDSVIEQTLKSREKEVINRRFPLNGGQNPMQIKEISELLGIPEQTARNLKSRALRKLRIALEEKFGITN